VYPIIKSFAIAAAWALLPLAVQAQDQQAGVVNLQAAGDLAATQTLSCLPMSQVKNSYTPPDLYTGVQQCITDKAYDKAAPMFMLARLYTLYDIDRVSDQTVGDADTVLRMKLFSPLDETQKQAWGEAMNKFTKDPASMAQLCKQAQQIGHPTYVPTYLIKHGMGAFTSGASPDKALKTGFDGDASWSQLVAKALRCPAA
jgi:hypothetical protein